MRDKVINLLKDVHRKGVVDLTSFLDSSDFYVAPCSTKYHLAIPCGLAQHTLNVIECLITLNKKYSNLYQEESVILAGLSHDLCKVNFYREFDEPPTDPQVRYLTSLLAKVGLKMPSKLNKSYVGNLIDFMLKTYKKGMEIPAYTPNYIIEDKLPLGHGEKSLYLIQQYIELTWDEAVAIRWHMGAWDLAESAFQKPAYNEAVNKSKLLTMLTIADTEATHLMEV